MRPARELAEAKRAVLDTLLKDLPNWQCENSVAKEASLKAALETAEAAYENAMEAVKKGKGWKAEAQAILKA